MGEGWVFCLIGGGEDSGILASLPDFFIGVYCFLWRLVFVVTALVT